MAKIASFRGYRYNKAEVGDLNKVVTQPYDIIDDTLRDEYYNRNEYNVVRIIKGVIKELDNPNDNQYTRAAGFWNKWIDERVLIKEGGPAIYAYFQEYTVEGTTYIRKGLIALVDLDDDNAKVRAHEKTLSGPKADRLKLMKATEANDGQIFMLYDDPENRINDLVEGGMMGAKPVMEVKDDFGAIHRLYRITRPGVILDINDVFENLELFIADGHHRFETAVNYMNECNERNWKPVGSETFTFRMMTMVNMHDPGLTILPTHRLVHSLDGFNPDKFLAKAASDFEITEYVDRSELYTALNEGGKAGKSVFGFSAEGIDGYRLLTLKDPTLMDKLVEGEHSEIWSRLDVTVLHTALLDRILGITAEKLASYSNVHYIRGRDEILDLVGKDGNQAAFLINATRMDQVRDVALAGERMPQKSTDFFPKLLTGMVMMKMQIDKSMGLARYDSE
ncbi:MAG: DUF1015 domain-containing protein [Candidatus Hatepunaea meridiana]|nr:DUF1015 domain-containing protein [Candidatus Hatepunaea meridiana]